MLVTTTVLHDSTTHGASGIPHDADSICLVTKLSPLLAHEYICMVRLCLCVCAPTVYCIMIWLFSVVIAIVRQLRDNIESAT